MMMMTMIMKAPEPRELQKASKRVKARYLDANVVRIRVHLREDNERLREEHSRVAEQQVRIVASLRGEVRFLRDELTRRVAPKLGERPAVPNGCSV
ncbi:hypothetical protein HPB50_012848 [Hyalomma asiaticum]|uniref:Uncharacterized protein n=1 Tax=Hyalomma asiaticum TaxID=266040 RepID=A0ACB7SQH9_HYAAI|nr:hypothetical protein HPB50_012848 [Hyalomma asiaticum]